jgi:hypothetical protein
MDIHFIIGVVVAGGAFLCSTAILIYSIHIINRIAKKNLFSLMEIEQEFKRGQPAEPRN